MSERHRDSLMCQAEAREDCGDPTHWTAEAEVSVRCPRFDTHDCLCPPGRLDPDCPAAIRDDRIRRMMAAAWDDGMAAFSLGLGSDDNPYRKWSQ